MGFSTDAIHAGQDSDPVTGAVVPPLYLTTTYQQEAPGQHKGFDYSRTVNPTRLALEKNLAALEKGEWGLCFASGMAAISTVVQSFGAGDRIVASANCYGGTYRVLKRVFERFGIGSAFVDTSDPDTVAASLDERTRLVLLETPTNPNLALTDIAAVAKVTRDRGVLMMVDNTFATPFLQQPLELGADLVVHSTTKYLGGHSDSVGGAVVGRDPETYQTLKFIQNAYGAILSPFDSWLTLRGIKTLALRMERHCHNALLVARYLSQSHKVLKVYYPGLASHPQRELAERQMRAFGGIVSFDLGSMEAAKRFAAALSLGKLAESLGAVETLVNHPAIMTHASIPESERLKSGITDGLLRISVGIEDIEDLMADLEGALKAV
jgi:cystathionine beta-lyase/cystathionine gamma-synthase